MSKYLNQFLVAAFNYVCVLILALPLYCYHIVYKLLLVTETLLYHLV